MKALHRRHTDVLGTLFGEDFDRAASRSAHQPEILTVETAEAHFTQHELDAACRIAREQGAEAARSSEAAMVARSRANSFVALAEILQKTADDTRTISELAAEHMARIVLAFLQGVLPRFCEQHGQSEVDSIVRHLLPILAREPHAVIRVNAHAVDDIRAELTDYPDLASRIKVIPTDAIPGKGLEASWDEGDASWNTDAILTAMYSALAELGLEVQSPEFSVVSGESAKMKGYQSAE